MTRIYSFLTCLLLGCSTAPAHEFWVDAESYPLRAGEVAGIVLGSGHYFPESDRAPDSRVIHRMAVEVPDGDWIELEPGDDNGYAIPFDEPGTYRAYLVLQPRGSPIPVYMAQAVLPVEESAIEWPEPIGEGLEVVARKSAESGILISVLHEGEPVRSSVVIQPEEGRTQRIRTVPDQPVHLQTETGIRYLITARRGQQSASLLFRLP